MQTFGILGMVYKNLIALICKFSNGLEFEWHEKYGWLTTNIEVLGSGLCCKVCLKLKQSVDCIRDYCDKMRIKITPINVTTENEHIIELTNRHTFGVSEFECVKEFYDTVKEIIKILEECGTQNDMESEKQNETQHETALESAIELNSQESGEKSSEVNNENNEGDKSKDDEQSPAVEEYTAKNVENNEQKGDDENLQNEQVSNTVLGVGDEATSEENPPVDSDMNENNTDNLADGEQVIKDTPLDTNKNFESNESEANQNENTTNETEADSPEKPNVTEDQSVKVDEVQPTEG